jgi:hypothetical protein
VSEAKHEDVIREALRWCPGEQGVLAALDALVRERDAWRQRSREQAQKLAIAGVEGSPPPGQDTTIGQLRRPKPPRPSLLRRLRTMFSKPDLDAQIKQFERLEEALAPIGDLPKDFAESLVIHHPGFSIRYSTGEAAALIRDKVRSHLDALYAAKVRAEWTTDSTGVNVRVCSSSPG